MKTFLKIVMALAFIACFGVVESGIGQFFYTASCAAVLFGAAKIYEKYYMTKKEKEERV